MNSVLSELLKFFARASLLAYSGGVLIVWMHRLLSEGTSHLHMGSDNTTWLGAGTLALPMVAAAQWLSERRGMNAQVGDLRRAALYGMAMGAASLLTMPEVATGTALAHVVAVIAVAALLSLLIDRAMTLIDALYLPGSPTRPGWALRLGMPAALFAALIASTLLGGPERAAAQTVFPEQAIHPRGSLLLIAKNPGDGTMAFVAPDYGPNGLRPTIEMTEGETLNITLKNELNVDVSLHVHGVDYSQDSDGTRHSGSFVKPGQTRVYQWRARPGTSGYWHFHDHVVGDDEGSTGILAGLYGGLVVRKPGDPKPAKTFIIVGHDKTLNGRIYPDTPLYKARQGELVEWIIISHGNRPHTFHLHGHRWLTPNRTGDPNPAAPQNAGNGREDNHILAPGDSFGFLIVAGEGVGPGKWMYHCHFQDHASAMKGFFEVQPSGAGGSGPPTQASRTFPETGKTISGRFLEYWNANGGISQQGFPISEPFTEKSDLDGKMYQVQYFERAVFELHPENPPPFDVLLSQLGTFRFREKYPNGR